MPPPRAFQPAFAALLAACVVLLGLAAVSPELHEMICSHHERDAVRAAYSDAPARSSDADDDHGCVPDDHPCAVTLFAAGCDTPVAFTLCPPVPRHAEGVASFTELLLSRTLRGPERVCGPPARG